MLKMRGILTVLAFGILLCLVTGGLSFAADAKTTAVSFGCVDLEKVFNESTKKKTLDGELQTFRDQLRLKLELRNANKLLTEEDYTQLVTLSTKPSPTDAEKKAIEDLTNKSRANDQEFQTLQQKKDTTDAEKARFAALQEQLAKTDEAIRADANQFQVELQQKMVDLSQQVMNDINKAVEEVAKAKGLSVVFNKTSGETIVVVYSSVDITNDVIQKVNKK